MHVLLFCHLEPEVSIYFHFVLYISVSVLPKDILSFLDLLSLPSFFLKNFSFTVCLSFRNL